MSTGGSVAGDDVNLIVTDKDGKIKKVVFTSKSKDAIVQHMQFCPDCGKTLNEIPLFVCVGCGNRYGIGIEPQTGKTIIFALGRESKPLRESL